MTLRNQIGKLALLTLLATGMTSCQEQKKAEDDKAFNKMFSQNENIVKDLSKEQASTERVDLTMAASMSVQSVVHIRATQLSKRQIIEDAPDLWDFYFGDGHGRQHEIQTQPRVGFGSGVIISKDGYIVTNHHVVDGADEIAVKLNDERTFRGKLIGSDAATDLALLKIKGEDLPTIPIGNSDNLKVGEWVLAVGNPFNLNSTVTAGIVSAKARSMSSTAADGKTATVQSFIQTDAAINAGNSGGALVNAEGQLVGINTMLYSPTGSYSGYGFAIPTTIMKKIVTDLKNFGSVQRAVLGVSGTPLNTDLTRMNDNQLVEMKRLTNKLGVSKGFMVAEIQQGSPAALAGLKPFDVILSVDSHTVNTFSDLQEVLAQHRPGDKVMIEVVRNKQNIAIEVQF